MIKSIAVLGSSGSVGRQTLEVALSLGVKVDALAAAGNNIGLLLEQIKLFMPRITAVRDGESADLLLEAIYRDETLKKAYGSGRINLLSGADGLRAAASQSGAGTVVVAVSGFAGLPAVMSAIEAGKDVALANKETLVYAGRLVMETARRRGVRIIPVDSEHSAIFQCLRGQNREDVKRIILTASGGPFLGRNKEYLDSVTPPQAMAHPVWKMGRQISVDSATMMNKGLEVIEASRLFDIGPDEIDVIIHPQSVIHSMVEFRDNVVIAQMGVPDMRAPIQYALTYPERVPGLQESVDFFGLGRLSFEKPDTVNFPCLSLAYGALRAGGTMPAVCGAANEAAVAMFLNGEAGFNDIPAFIEGAMGAHRTRDDMSLENIFNARAEARETVMGYAGCANAAK